MMLGGALQGHHASQSEEEGVVKAGMGRPENVILSLMSYGRTEEREQRSWKGSGDCHALSHLLLRGHRWPSSLIHLSMSFRRKVSFEDWTGSRRAGLQRLPIKVCVFGNSETRGNRSQGLSPTGHGLMTGDYCCHYRGPLLLLRLSFFALCFAGSAR